MAVLAVISVCNSPGLYYLKGVNNYGQNRDAVLPCVAISIHANHIVTGCFHEVGLTHLPDRAVALQQLCVADRSIFNFNVWFVFVRNICLSVVSQFERIVNVRPQVKLKIFFIACR